MSTRARNVIPLQGVSALRQQLPSRLGVMLVDDDLDWTASREPARPRTRCHVCLAIGAPDAVGPKHPAEHFGFRLVVHDRKAHQAHVG